MFVLPKMLGHEHKHTHLSVLGLLQPEASLLHAATKTLGSSSSASFKGTRYVYFMQWFALNSCTDSSHLNVRTQPRVGDRQWQYNQSACGHVSVSCKYSCLVRRMCWFAGVKYICTCMTVGALCSLGRRGAGREKSRRRRGGCFVINARDTCCEDPFCFLSTLLPKPYLCRG